MPILTRDERKSKDNDDNDEQENEAENDVATSAEAPPRLDGGSGGKNGKKTAAPCLSVAMIKVSICNSCQSSPALSEIPSAATD